MMPAHSFRNAFLPRPLGAWCKMVLHFAGHALWAVFFFLFILLQAQVAVAQDYDWAKVVGGSSIEYARSIERDRQGNIYVTGIFGQTVDFDPGPGVHNVTATGNYNGYLLKLDAMGGFIWVKPIPNIGFFSDFKVKIDQAGNIYLAGTFFGTIDLDLGPATHLLTSAGDDDGFVAKYDASINLLWSGSIGGVQNETIKGMDIDSAGRMYCSGLYNGTADLDPTGAVQNFLAPGAGNLDQGFVFRLSASGTVDWVHDIGSTNDDHCANLVLDQVGNLYMTGTFTGTVDFDGGAGSSTLSSGVIRAAYLLKWDVDAHFIWVTKFGGQSTTYGAWIALGPDRDEVYISGTFSNSVDIDCGPGTLMVSSNMSGDQFVAKTDSAGIFQWGGSITAPIYNESPGNICVDHQGNLYILSEFEGRADFALSPTDTLLDSTIGFHDGFIEKVDRNGTMLWLKFLRSEQDNFPREMDVDTNGTMLFVGDMSWATDFDPGPGVANSIHALSDFYLARWLDCHVTWDTSQVTACNDYSWHGQTLTASGTYVDTLSNGAGCDSITVLQLTLFSANSSSTQVVDTCNFFIANGHVYSTSGTFTQVIPNSLGCDSTITWVVTILDDTHDTLTLSGCDSVVVNGQPYTASGTYLQMLLNANGCDSLLHLHITVVPNGIDTSVTVAGNVLTANAIGASYQWVDCNNSLAPILGAVNASYTVTASGSYAVLLGQNGCGAVSSCFPMTIIGTPEVVGASLMSVFPNPSDGQFSLRYGGLSPLRARIQVVNALGQVVLSDDVSMVQQYDFDLGDAAAGVYLLQVRVGGTAFSWRLVKE